MAWYKFLIYFSLIAGAIINFIYSFGYISGSIYLVQTNGEFYAEQIYAYYGKNLQVVDVFYGFFLIAFAILSLVVRHKLANYKPDSLKFVKIFYSISVAVPFLYDFSVAKIIGQSLSVQTVIYAIFGLIFLLLNIKYFNKRSHLFVDKTVWTQTNFQSPTQAEQEDGESSIVSKPAVLDNQADMFCRKCGTKLHEDSAFCHYCGTPIGKSANTSFTNTAPPISHSNVSKQRSKKRTVIIAIIIVLALVFTAGIVALFMNNNESDGNNSDRPATVYNVAVRTISLSDKYTAENILTTWRNGKATEQSLIEIMDEYGAWQGGGKLYVIERGEFVEEIDEWCFSTKRKVGDCAIIENEYGYSICYISGFNEKDNDDWNDNTPSYEDIGVTFEQNILARMITDDPVAYCEYIVELDKTLSKGSYGIDLQKEKATEYVNNLPLDYGQRIILFKIQFPADTTYCNDIVEYLNEMEALSYDDRVFILEELGFAVFEDGTVKW